VPTALPPIAVVVPPAADVVPPAAVVSPPVPLEIPPVPWVVAVLGLLEHAAARSAGRTIGQINFLISSVMEPLALIGFPSQ
jgi:hypothetical protein